MTDEYMGYFVIKSCISSNHSVLLSVSIYIHSLEVGCNAVDQRTICLATEIYVAVCFFCTEANVWETNRAP